MLATHSPTFLLKTQNYSPEDLESMRQAFMRACGENPQMAETEAQRSNLARVFVRTYKRYLTQSELVAAALSETE